MQWDSPAVLTIAGTIAIHVLLLVGADVVTVTNPPQRIEIPPHLEIVDIEVPKAKPKPPPPPAPKPEVKEEPKVEPVKAAPVARAARTVAHHAEQPRQAAPPPPSGPTNASDPGGAPAPTTQTISEFGGIALPEGKGQRPTDRTGQGGKGIGTGSGAGSGAEAGTPPPPASVATIKKRAMPKGDYSYVHDYPAEARRLGIEGAIRVKLVVDAQGHVVDAQLINRLGHGLDELALERTKTMVFEPALDTDDKPVRSIVVWTFNMVVPK